MLDLSKNAMSPEAVAELTYEQRIARVDDLRQEAFAIYREAVKVHITDANRSLTATCVLFSGGNDSTVLFDLFRNKSDYAIHANTTIGIEQTRQFVRDVCQQFDKPLLEFYPPEGSTYRDLVIDQGFPGPGMHFKMYQRLKERALRQARRQLVSNPRQQRVVFLAGRRRTESARRASIPAYEREGSVVWVSPLVNWTKMDMMLYRENYSITPRNEVSDLIHMSGECLCGAFAHKNELEEIAVFFPEVAEEIRALEAEVRAAGHPEKKCKWGWGANVQITDAQLKSGPLCTSCEYRMEEVTNA